MREQMEQDNDTMREEIAAWYCSLIPTYMYIYMSQYKCTCTCTCVRVQVYRFYMYYGHISESTLHFGNMYRCTCSVRLQQCTVCLWPFMHLKLRGRCILHHIYIYICSKKQQQDDKKALERGNKELVRLDQQLKVSTAQFTKLRDLNHMLSKRFEEEKARTGDVEYNLKVCVHVNVNVHTMYIIHLHVHVYTSIHVTCMYMYTYMYIKAAGFSPGRLGVTEPYGFQNE